MSGAGVAHFPITPPASLRSHGSRPRPTRHIPPSPLAGRGVPTRLRSTPPPLPSGGDRSRWLRGPGGRTDRRGERKGDGRMRSDRDERGERGKKNQVPRHAAARPSTGCVKSSAVPGGGTGRPSVDGTTLLRRPVDGDGSSGFGQPAGVPRSLLLPILGRWQQAPAIWRTAPTPPLPHGRQPPLHITGGRQRVRPSPATHSSPPPRASTAPDCYALLHGTADSPQRQGIFGSASLLPPGFRHQCNNIKLHNHGKKEAGTGGHSNKTLMTK